MADMKKIAQAMASERMRDKARRANLSGAGLKPQMDREYRANVENATKGMRYERGMFGASGMKSQAEELGKQLKYQDARIAKYKKTGFGK